MRTETISALDPARTEARLFRWMLALGSGGTLAVLVGGHARAGLGFALGATLAVLNYLWLQQAVAALMTAAQSRLPKAVVAKFLVRYPMLFAGVWVCYRTGWLPLAAVLAGLFVPIGGVLIESLFLARECFRHVGSVKLGVPGDAE